MPGYWDFIRSVRQKVRKGIEVVTVIVGVCSILELDIR